MRSHFGQKMALQVAPHDGAIRLMAADGRQVIVQLLTCEQHVLPLVAHKWQLRFDEDGDGIVFTERTAFYVDDKLGLTMCRHQGTGEMWVDCKPSEAPLQGRLRLSEYLALATVDAEVEVRLVPAGKITVPVTKFTAAQHGFHISWDICMWFYSMELKTQKRQSVALGRTWLGHVADVLLRSARFDMSPSDKKGQEGRCCCERRR